MMRLYFLKQKGWFLFGFVFLIFINTTKGQNNDEQLAQHYFYGGEFEKAELLYEKILKKNPTSIYFYDRLLQCKLKLGKNDEALKFTKRLSKQYYNQPVYIIDYCIINEKVNPAKGNKEWDNFFKQLVPDEIYINSAAEILLQKKIPEKALKTYYSGRALLKNEHIWSPEVGKILGILGKKQEMIDEYLLALEFNPSYQEQIQNQLQTDINDPDISASVKTALYKSLQKNPNNEVLMDMLIWFEIQKQNYKAAFIQLSILDKKQNLGGKRILDLARLAYTNRFYDFAFNFCKYIIDQGNTNRYYSETRNFQLQIFREKVLNQLFTVSDLKEIEMGYRSYISEYGVNNQTAQAVYDFADFLAYYLNKPDTAVKMLETLIGQPRVSNQLKAQSKLLLGDIYILTGNFWDPVLLYGQVDKEFKEDPLGQEAKFRNARLSYFKGDFEWSQAQLDVLKQATSQLISNNSIELSLMIQDNLGLDSNEEAMQLYSQAELLQYQSRYEEALTILDTLYVNYPFHSLSDEILYLKSKIYRKQNKYDSCLILLEKIYTIYKEDILADNAMFDAASILELNLKKRDEARVLYEKLFSDFPGSLFAVEARHRYRILRGDPVN